jgi:hypothetical protein
VIVADAWQPATDDERRMRELLRDGDQESYYRVLAETELIVPVDPETVDEVLEGSAKPSWPTIELAGRTSVPVYTSAPAMRAAAGQRFQHFLKLKFAEIAEAWPEPGWWLLVNEGLPIQGHLPSWFVTQLAGGDHRPPSAGLPRALPAAATDAQPAIAAPTAPTAPSAHTGPTPPTARTRPTASAASAASAASDRTPATLSAPTATPLDTSDGIAASAGPGTSNTLNGTGTSAAETDETDGDEPAAAARPDTFVPAGEVEVNLLDAVQRGDNDAFLQALAEADVLLQMPEDADVELRPGRPGFPWPMTDIGGRVSIPLFTSIERLRDMAGPTPGPATRLSFPSVIRYWPSAATALAINPGTTLGASLPGEQIAGLAEWADHRTAQRMAARFEPQNDVEQRLFDAAGRRDRDAFFKILLGSQVVVPADPETPWGTRPGEADFPWHPVLVNGKTSVLAFTSLRWMHDAIGPCRFLMPEFLDLVSAWPEADWTLVLNPGTPVDATLPGEQVRALAGTPEPAPPVPGGAAAVPDFEPGNRVDEELLDAALRGDTDAFLRVLLSAGVLVPIPDDASPDIIPGDAEFRWDAAMKDATTVQVFTSYERLREGQGGSRYVQAAFRELITAWPDAGWTMALNPGTRIGATLRGHQVRELSEWSIRVGLNSAAPTTAALAPPAPPSPSPTTPAGPAATSAPSPVPAPAPMPAAAPTPAAEATADWSPLAMSADAPMSSAGSSSPPAAPIRRQPMIMQKVLAHAQVSWYLDQGYDRVGGYVHPAGDVTDLQTPGQLYQALGLLYADSPFAAQDEGVYVIRWPAYCEELYRIPFGGQAEADMRAWGEAGWVIEQAPFRGDGFASGSGGTIREFKVDSVRLPSGAEMYYLGRDRSERFIAVYDPDRLAWLRATEEENVS